MAAGMGSRYGGLKQIDPVDPYGNIIIDFSTFDAREAGFEKVIFIIKKAIENDFKMYGRRLQIRSLANILLLRLPPVLSNPMILCST